MLGGIFAERTARENRRAAEAVASGRISQVGIPNAQTVFSPVVPQQRGISVPGSGPFDLQEAHQANMIGPAAVFNAAVRVARNPVFQGAVGGAVGAAVTDEVMVVNPVPGQQSMEVSGVSGVAQRKCGVHMGNLFHQTPTGRMSANKVSLIPDGQGGAAFFVNAGCPTAWSKVSIKKPRRCRPR